MIGDGARAALIFHLQLSGLGSLGTQEAPLLQRLQTELKLNRTLAASQRSAQLPPNAACWVLKTSLFPFPAPK